MYISETIQLATWLLCDTLSFAISLSDAVPLIGAYDGGGASPVGLQGQEIRCSGR